MSEPEPFEPQREDSSSGLGRLFDAARRDPGMDSGAVQRVAERAAESPPPSPRGSIAALAAIGLALLGIVAWNAHHEAPRPTRPPATTVATEPLGAPSITPVAAPAEFAPLPIEPPVMRRPRAKRREVEPIEVPVEGSPASPTEGALLLHARVALRSDPTRALSLAEEHRAAYPEGEMAAEREVLAIEALASLSRFGAARARAARFAGSYPASPYRGRVYAALARESNATP